MQKEKKSDQTKLKNEENEMQKKKIIWQKDMQTKSLDEKISFRKFCTICFMMMSPFVTVPY